VMKDPWGGPLYYFPSSILTAGGIESVTTTPITLMNCFSDDQCSTFLRTNNLSFLVVSAGPVVYSASSPISQSSQLTASTAISSQTFFKSYTPTIMVGPFDESNVYEKRQKYDDQIVFGTLEEVYSAGSTLSKSKGDVLEAGGDLKVLNTSPLPQGTCGTPYSKTLTAYGKDSGVFSWSITSLPAGLAVSPSVGKTALISGTPADDGVFSVVASITDSNNRQASKTLSLTIVSPGWSNIAGSTRTSSCASGMLGSIAEQEQTNSCGTSQWVATSNTCANTSTFDGRPRGSTLIAAGASASSTNTGQTSIAIGAGTAAVAITARSNTGTLANISRESTATTSNAVGVVGGSSIYINPGESITLGLAGGAARTFGIEFYGFGINTGGAGDRVEDAIVTLTNTLTATVVATYTLNACVTDTATVRSTFFLPDPGAEFNEVKITAGTVPANTDFMIRAFRACGVGASCTPTAATATTCPFP